jgi:hypothetical protein
VRFLHSNKKPASTKKAGAYFLVYLRFSALICSQDFGFLRVAAPSSRKFISAFFAFFRG